MSDRADAMDIVRSALKAALIFASDEVENREASGGTMTDYVNEAQNIVDECLGALAVLQAVR